MDALEVLLKGDRAECADKFGVGLMMTAKDTPETVLQKCQDFKARYEGYLENIKFVIDNQARLEDYCRKAKTAAYVKGMDEEQQKALLALLQEKFAQ